MTEPRLLWMDQIPPEVQGAFEPLLRKWITFVPSWCRELIIRWDEKDDDSDLTCFSVMEYRWARITIFPSWLRRSEVERSEEVLHEILHIQLEPVKNMVITLLALFKEKYPDLQTWGDELRRHAEESTICDLTWAIAGANGRVHREREAPE